MEKDEKRLTEHFRMDEFVYSAMAVEFGLNNAFGGNTGDTESNGAVVGTFAYISSTAYVYHEWLSKRRVKPISGRCP